MTTTIDSDSVTSDPTSIDDTDSPYSSQGENRIEVDTTNGAVTVTLSSSDVVSGFSILIVDVGENAATNNITINTEGSENINPGANSSITLSVDGTFRKLWSDGSNWFADTAPELSTVTADTGNITTSNNDVINIADTSTDPSSNGEIRLNGTDAKIQSGGVVQNLSNVNEGFDTTVVSSNTSTSDEDVIYADASGGPITITLSSSDVSNGNAIRVVNVEGSNAVTVDTEGSETIDPNAESSKTINNAGWGYSFVSDGTNWDASQAAEFESLSTGSVKFDQGLTWEEDDNSPLTITTSESSATITLAGQYKVVKCIIVDANSELGQFSLRVNGDTGANYDWIDLNGTTNSGATSYDNISTYGQSIGAEITLSGEWEAEHSIGQVPHAGFSDVLVTGTNASVTSPLDSITFLDDGGSTAAELTVRVIGATET